MICAAWRGHVADRTLVVGQVGGRGAPGQLRVDRGAPRQGQRTPGEKQHQGGAALLDVEVLVDGEELSVCEEVLQLGVVKATGVGIWVDGEDLGVHGCTSSGATGCG